MSTVEEIQYAVKSLPKDKYRLFRQWFSEQDWLEWDMQFENDVKSGKLNHLRDEALQDNNLADLSQL